jgi:protein TonB
MSTVTYRDPVGLRPFVARIRENLGERAVAAALALGLEALLLLALITLGQRSETHKEVPLATVSFDVRDRPEKPAQPEKAKAKARPSAPARQSPTREQAQAQPTNTAVAPPQPPAAVIPVSPQAMRSFDLANVPRPPKAPPGPAYGPAFTPSFGDSQRVGTAPNGQPMYAASWYPHEPTHEQMAGYLSTADPGWALITCKTVPDYRVEDCVGLDEYPENSHLIRAVLAASWQFRVRPPRVNGVLQVGDWVRIRITYEEVAAPAYGDADKR